MAGLNLLYKLLLKDAAKGSGKASGIMSIGSDIRKIAMNKYAKYVDSAKKQGVDLDKMSEQDIKYILQLNKPKPVKAISADSPEGKLFTQGLNDMLGKASGANVIKTDFGGGITDDVSEIIIKIKTMKPMDSMKEANKVLKGEGRYKSLSKADREKIVNDESVTDHIFERNVDVDPEDFAYGGVAGMLGERTRYSGGGNGQDDSMVGISMSIEERWERIKKILKQMEDIKSGKTTDPDPEEKAQGGRMGTGLNYLLGEDDQNSRVPFKKGHSAGRRNFLKGIGALAALPVVGKFFKWAKPLAKTSKVADLTSIPIKSGVEGMPYWFKPLVNKVIKEGEDVTKVMSTKEREIVHQIGLEGKISKDALGVEDIRVTQSLDDGTIRVQYNSSDSIGESGVELVYKKGEEIPITKKGKSTSVTEKDEFTAVEDDFYPQQTSPDGDFDLEFTENVVNKVDDLYSDTSKLKQFATGKKPTIKEVSESIKKKNIVKEINANPNDHAFRNAPDYDPHDLEDFASGGRVPLGTGGGIMKLLKLLKSKPKKSYERIDLQKLLKGNKKIPVYSGSMKRQSNTWQSFIEDAKKLGTTPEKIAKDKFKGQWFTPYREYAESFMDPKDLTSKMRTVELDPKEIAMAKRYVDKVNKTDIISMRKNLGIKDAKGEYPKQNITTDDNLVLIPKIKLKKLKKENRIMTDYLIKEKIQKKLGLAEGGRVSLSAGGVAGMLGE